MSSGDDYENFEFSDADEQEVSQSYTTQSCRVPYTTVESHKWARHVSVSSEINYSRNYL